jgi:hypothetical protein
MTPEERVGEDGGHPEWSPGWLADEVIGIVQREPTEPTGCGMHAIVAGLFEQFAARATAAERERCAGVAENGSFLHDQSPAAIFGRDVARAIRRGT